MGNKQTAVEWLNQRRLKNGFNTMEDFHQAKQMERQQIIEAWCDASPPHEDITIWAEEYYNRNHESTDAA